MLKTLASASLVLVAASAWGASPPAVGQPANSPTSPRPSAAEWDEVASRTALEPYFEEAASEFGVPAALLKAIAYVESKWLQIVPDETDTHHQIVYGVMGLRDDDWFGHSLLEAARLVMGDRSRKKVSDRHCARENMKRPARIVRAAARSDNLVGGGTAAQCIRAAAIDQHEHNA